MDLCRLCLSTEALSSDLNKTLTEKDPTESIRNVLMKIFRIQLNESLDMTEAICDLCFKRLEETHEFYRKILESQVILEERIKQKTELHLPVPSEMPSKIVENVNFDTKTDESVSEKVNNVPKSPNRKSKTEKSESKKTRKRKEDEDDRIIKEFYGLICRKCDEPVSFDNLTQLRDHNRSVHSIQATTIECCSKVLKKRGQLLDHAKIHINPDELTCNECGKTCHNRYRLKVHQLQHHAPDNTKTFQCSTCNKRFFNSSNLRAHLKTHLSQEEKDAMRTHICPTCNNAFMSKSLLAHHIRQIHEKVYTCVCDICAKSFKTKMHFLSHYKHVHTNPEQIKVQCQICGKWLANEQALKKHVRLNHEDPGPHICKDCGKEAPTKNALISHERYMHKSENKFKCQFCIKCFKKPIHLKEHLTTHLGGVLYRCDFCEKTFNSGANYFKHRKQKHQEEIAKNKKL